MDKQIKEIDFPLTLDTDSWSDKSQNHSSFKLETSAWEDLKETLVVAGLVGMRGRGELIVFLSFGVGPVGMRKGTQESFLNLLVV